MDSPLLSSIFRQLFRHSACQRRAVPTALREQRTRITSHSFATSSKQLQRPTNNHNAKKKDPAKREWQPRSHIASRDMSEEFKRYPLVTAEGLARRRERPKMVKMLARDFIDDSLYNPHYGYFSKEAVIFSTDTIKFKRLKDDNEFQNIVRQEYITFEDKLDEDEPNDTRQLWHTPTELFRPYYGEAIARYLHEMYMDLYPEYDLIIYEMGAGNGTLMVNILDYLRDRHPDVYIRTQFKVIEISSRLADRQRRIVAKNGHTDRVEIINTSIFNFNTYVSSPCFFLALEIFDNFAHDMLRYDPVSEQALQGMVLIDQEGDFHEFYTPSLDDEVKRYFDLKRRIHDPEYDQVFDKVIAKDFTSMSGRQGAIKGIMNELKKRVTFSSNLSAPEFIPTRMMQFFELLNARFPHHRLVMSDFHYLPDTIEGVNAPVVQTRYQRTTVPVTTLFVQQGYFDIFFPTDFGLMNQMYQLITGKLSRVVTHEEYMKQWAELPETTTRSGENPLLSWYKNASVMYSM